MGSPTWGGRDVYLGTAPDGRDFWLAGAHIEASHIEASRRCHGGPYPTAPVRTRCVRLAHYNRLAARRALPTTHFNHPTPREEAP